MKGKKFLVVGICSMVIVGLCQRASAADNDVPVIYNYSGAAEPVSPNYAVVIPTGLVFDAKNPFNVLTTDVELKPAQGQTAITMPSKAKVSVKSENEYKVQLSDGSDAIDYAITYEGVTLTGPTSQPIGVLVTNVQNTPENLKIEGTAKLKGVATKTGAHTDKLIYTIVDDTPASGS